MGTRRHARVYIEGRHRREKVRGERMHGLKGRGIVTKQHTKWGCFAMMRMRQAAMAVRTIPVPRVCVTRSAPIA